ncbi:MULTISPECIES: phosphate ABC transporter permease [Haloarcula]|uniref:phosphate ABC transporter permease n=1 Tax=Haloarcula TaxID=2237 RepID=UPI0023ECDC20|nr:phosphate ABC transporter permease [Halomicroarcula sp. XH51]
MSVPSVARRWAPPVDDRSRRAATVAGSGFAAVALTASFVARLAVNAPLTLPGGVAVGGQAVGVAPGPLAAMAMVLAALGAVSIGVTRSDPAAGVGLLFVGVFGGLALVSRGAAMPAAVAVAAGTGTVALASRRSLCRARGLATTVLVAALGLALASGVGDWTALRPLASTFALGGVALTPLFAATDAESLLGGALAFVVVLVVGLSVPFVTGAVTLVGGGVVGAGLPFVALAVAGAVTAASAAARTRRWTLLAGIVLVALAGVPASLPRAVPFALGVAVLVTREAGR